MIDLAELAKLVANVLGGVAILAVVIMAAVAYLKQWGVTGKALTAAGFAVGVVLALVVRYAMSPMVTFYDWTWAGLFGLMAGFLATGAYKVADGLADKTGSTMYTVTHYADPLGLYVDDDDEPGYDDSPVTD